MNKAYASYISEELLSLSEPEYRDFMAKLLTTVPKDKILGVRMPYLRKIAKKIKKSGREIEFISQLPHTYYEEDAIHAFIIMDFDDGECIREIKRFLPYVNNWGICDSLRPISFSLNKESLLTEIKEFLHSEHIYTVRFGIEMLMLHYLNENFSPEMPRIISEVKGGDYYLDMMVAWYFATALAFRYEEILPCLTERRLSVWVHNKTICKAVESHRISADKKEYLKTLRIKGKDKK